MKPRPQYDFPIFVRRQAWEEEADQARYYEGIFDVSLNGIVSVMFVPAPDRMVWPPVLPQSADEIHSEDEARAISITVSRFAVTTDDTCSGTERSFARDWSEAGPGTVFFVSEAQFATLSTELARLADERPSVHSGWKISEIADLSVTHLLLNRIVASSRLPQDDRRMLGR